MRMNSEDVVGGLVPASRAAVLAQTLAHCTAQITLYSLLSECSSLCRMPVDWQLLSMVGRLKMQDWKMTDRNLTDL